MRTLATSLLLGVLAIAQINAAYADCKKEGKDCSESAQCQPQQQSLTEAEQWVLHRTEPWAMQNAAESKKSKHPVKRFVKAVGRGAKAELGQTFSDLAKDTAFVFSVTDIDPYDKSAPPMNKPAVVMEANLVDGTSCYLHRFPDNSFAIEGGFADNTVMVPQGPSTYLVKYPNGATGELTKKNGEYRIVRSDGSVTTITKKADGEYDINNNKIGYMGSAHPDETGLQYELGSWLQSEQKF